MKSTHTDGHSAGGTGDASSFLADIHAVIGHAHVLTGEAVNPYAHDIFDAGVLPLAVVAPGTVAELRAVVQAAARAGVVLIPRGGGASYTDGYLSARAGAALLDLRRLNRIVDINETDAFVTVEAGVTWAALKTALDAKGLRTPFRGPFSGLVATVGGAVAQHAVSVGTGAHGGAAASVLSLDVVLANGELLRTGSASRGPDGFGRPFLRDFGPDLTGLFTGDCGAFGIKARVTLALMPAANAHAGASFAFASFDAMHAAMRAAAMLGLDDTHFAMDAALLRGQLRRKRGIKASIDIARGVLNRAPTWLSGAGQVLRMGLAGERAMRQAPFIAHYVIEGPDRQSVAHDLRRLRTAMRSMRHAVPEGQPPREIPNTVPAVVHAEPFARMFHIVGPKGERWVPVHGVLAHSAVPDFHRALGVFFETRADAMQRHGVWTGTMFESIGRGAFLYEVGIYWPDALSPYHLDAIDPRLIAKLPRYPAAPHAREWVKQLKRDLVALFDQHGATHFQLGKAYPFAETLLPSARDSLEGIKRLIDPMSLINPGALGLGLE